MFDPQELLNQSLSTPLADTYTPVPKGEYQATITRLDVRMAGERPVLDVHWTIIAPEEPLANEQEVRQTFWLDINDHGQLDGSPNKNVKLGKLLTGFKLNSKKTNLNQLMGQIGVVTVDHRESNGDIFADVTMAAAA